MLQGLGAKLMFIVLIVAHVLPATKTESRGVDQLGFPQKLANLDPMVLGKAPEPNGWKVFFRSRKSRGRGLVDSSL